MILDLFAGPGGWDEALASLGRTDVLGIEMDARTVETRLKAGHPTLAADVTTLNPRDFAPVEGLIASPPCQTFSAAGKQAGMADPRGELVYQVLRWADALEPDWIACEEVSEVLPIWHSFAHHLRGRGYHAWAGILNAADYGVPQSRKRAFLMAARRPFPLPKQTHTSTTGDDLFGTDLQPWITMAQALNLDESERTPLNRWAWERPATTVVRSFRPEVIAAPGWRMAGDGPRQNTPGSITVTVEQMCALQSVRPDYPFVGPPTKIRSLIGAFLPPPMAAAVLAPLLATVGAICSGCGNDEATDGHLVCFDCLEASA